MRGFGRFLDLSRRYGISPPISETLPMLEFIRSTTLTEGSVVLVPGPERLEYRIVPFDSFKSAEELADKVAGIFKDNNQKPLDEVYVLTEEQVDSPEGLTRFPLKRFLAQVVPYIFDHGIMWNYWVTDGVTTTVTFHTQDHVYWKKVSPVQATS